MVVNQDFYYLDETATPPWTPLQEDASIFGLIPG